MAVVACPILIGLAAVAFEITSAVLGNKWADATILIQILGVFSLAAIANSIYPPVLIVKGRTGTVLALGLLQNILTTILAALSSGFGPVAIMLSYVARGWIMAGISLYILAGTLGIAIARIIGIVFPAAFASVVMVAASLTVRLFLPMALMDDLRLVILIAVGAFTYFTVLIVGDLVGLWPSYVRQIVGDIRNVIQTSSKRVKAVAE
jgi:O-antigen/teichoic acid export membrane protein